MISLNKRTREEVVERDLELQPLGEVSGGNPVPRGQLWLRKSLLQQAPGEVKVGGVVTQPHHHLSLARRPRRSCRLPQGRTPRMSCGLLSLPRRRGDPQPRRWILPPHPPDPGPQLDGGDHCPA